MRWRVPRGEAVQCSGKNVVEVVCEAVGEDVRDRPSTSDAPDTAGGTREVRRENRQRNFLTSFSFQPVYGG